MKSENPTTRVYFSAGQSLDPLSGPSSGQKHWQKAQRPDNRKAKDDNKRPPGQDSGKNPAKIIGKTSKLCPVCKKYHRRRKWLMTTPLRLEEVDQNRAKHKPRIDFSKYWFCKGGPLKWLLVVNDRLPWFECTVEAVCDNPDPTRECGGNEIVDEFSRQFNRFRLFCFLALRKPGMTLRIALKGLPERAQ